MSRLVLSLLLAIVLQLAAAQAPNPQSLAAVGSVKKHSSGSSPFSAFTKSLPTEKKKPFMELMKRLRSAKNTSGVDKDQKKKITSGLDADIHKLLGTDYKRYRTVSATVKAEHAAKHATKTAASPPPVPVPATTTAAAAAKKKKASTTKKVKTASTTIG